MANFSPLQAQNFSLSGAGCSIGDVVLNLKSFKDILGVNIAMSDLGTIAYITIEPGNGTQEEQISFTGVTQNADGSAQLTGVKTVLFKSPYTETSGIRVTHPGSVVAILSNTAGFYNKFGILADNSAITGLWTSPDPVSSQGLATKAYVLSVVNGGTVSTDQVIVAGVAGENLTQGNIVYLKSDGAWWKASSATAATCLGVQFGVVQATVTTGLTATVLVDGLDKTQSGLVAGTTYYLSTGGALSTSAGTIPISIGVSITTSQLEFSPGFSTGRALASTTGRAGMIPIAGSGSTTLDSSWFATKFGGTGADGALSITSGTTTIDLAGAKSVVKNYTSISITGTGALAFSNPHALGTKIVLNSQGAVTLTSSATPLIDLRSLGGTGGAVGSDGQGWFGTGAVANFGSAATSFSSGGGGGGNVARGTNGTLALGGTVSDRSVSAGGQANFLSQDSTSCIPGGGGAGGRDGTGGGSSGTGGRGGGALVINCAGAYNATGVFNASGANGVSGSGSGTAGGGGGAGGSILVIYNTLTANSATYTVTGGTAGASGGGAGSAGGDGSLGQSLVVANVFFT